MNGYLLPVLPLGLVLDAPGEVLPELPEPMEPLPAPVPVPELPVPAPGAPGDVVLRPAVVPPVPEVSCSEHAAIVPTTSIKANATAKNFFISPPSPPYRRAREVYSTGPWCRGS
jgi:hypothetical protein